VFAEVALWTAICGLFNIIVRFAAVGRGFIEGEAGGDGAARDRKAVVSVRLAGDWVTEGLGVRLVDGEWLQRGGGRHGG